MVNLIEINAWLMFTKFEGKPTGVMGLTVYNQPQDRKKFLKYVGDKVKC